MSMKTPITYYGGKQTLLKHIKPLVPLHKSYTEAFCGGAALFFEKEPCEIEVINDINGNLINFYKVVKNDFNRLKPRINETLHSRREHSYAQIVYEYPEYFDDITRAWVLWLLTKQSFASKLDGSWGYDKTRNSMPKKLHNAKESFSYALCKRLERTQIESTDALRIIKSRDTIETFHFADPPYINSDCGHYKGYILPDFINLLDTLENIEGKFMLTMYPHAALRERIIFNNWKVETITRTISASKTNRRKQEELIVMNYHLSSK